MRSDKGLPEDASMDEKNIIGRYWVDKAVPCITCNLSHPSRTPVYCNNEVSSYCGMWDLGLNATSTTAEDPSQTGMGGNLRMRTYS